MTMAAENAPALLGAKIKLFAFSIFPQLQLLHNMFYYDADTPVSCFTLISHIFRIQNFIT
jgi:hypothetical protein